MRIGFFLGQGYPKINGGTYVIYEHATRLYRRGHQVHLITQQPVVPEYYAWHPSAHELDWLTLEQAKGLAFDLVLATWWQSTFLLHEVAARHYVYFIQSIESRFFPSPDPLNLKHRKQMTWKNLAEKTYSYNLPCITEARWIQDYLYQNAHLWPHLVRNGIRKDLYTPEGECHAPRQAGTFRVLVEGPVDVPYKNVPTAIRLARAAGVDEVWLLTSSAVEQYEQVDRVFSQVSIHETPAIYRSCDLLLKLSYVEGMFGPPLEMFHCGGTALVYAVTGHDEYIVHDHNSCVAALDDEEAVVRSLRYLKEQPKKLERLKQGAMQTAAQWPDWETCTAAFEQALWDIAAGRPGSRTYCQNQTEELFTTANMMDKARTVEHFADRERAVWEGKTASERHNFAQMYWDSQGQFCEEHSQWQAYYSEEWTDLLFTLRVEEVPLWLRLDLSIRMGMLEIKSLCLENNRTGEKILALHQAEEFQVLFLAEDVKWIFPDQKNILFIYGARPIIHLPCIQKGQAELGDSLSLRICFYESGMQDFFQRQQRVPLAQPWWKRLLP